MFYLHIKSTCHYLSGKINEAWEKKTVLENNDNNLAWYTPASRWLMSYIYIIGLTILIFL